MADENFFSRWSRRKAEVLKEDSSSPAPVTEKPVGAPARADSARPADSKPPAQPDAEQTVADQAKPQMTMEDVARLTPDSDFSAFVARGVDEDVKRSALKKLFSNPHFNVMDGLDIYIDDYSKPDPIPPEMLAALNHAKALLDPLSVFEKPQLPMIGTETDTVAEDDPTEANEAQPASAETAETAEPQPALPEPQAEDAALDPVAEAEPAPARQSDAATGTTTEPTQFSQDRS
jgi:hypothetical protein